LTPSGLHGFGHRAMKRELKAAGLFCLIAFALSWSIAGILFLTGAFAGDKAALGRAVAALLFPAGPAVAAVATLFWWRQRFEAEPLGLTLQLSPWVLIAWLVPAAIAAVTLVVCLLFPGLSFSFDPAAHPLPADAPQQMKDAYEQSKSASPVLRFVALLVQTLFQGTLLNLLFRAAEELGWRGLLLRLLAPFGFWRASILIGFLVGIWSMPLVLIGTYYPDHAQAGLFLVVPLMVLTSPLVTFFRLQSGSILGATLFSASLAAMVRFVLLPYVAGSDLLYGIPGVAGMIALVVVTAIIVLPRWRETDRELSQMVQG
jgi:membrane protease YdiL (CAAX protease family)